MAQPGCSSQTMVSFSNGASSIGNVVGGTVSFLPDQMGCRVGNHPYMMQLDLSVSTGTPIDTFQFTMFDHDRTNSITGPSFGLSGGDVGWLPLPDGFYGNDGIKMLPVKKAVGTFRLAIQLWISRYAKNPGQIFQIQGFNQGQPVLSTDVSICAGSKNCLFPLSCGPSGHCSSSAPSLMPSDGLCCCLPNDEQLTDQVGLWTVNQVSNFVPQLRHLLTSMMDHYSKISGTIPSIPGASYQVVMSQDLGTNISMIDYDTTLVSDCNCSLGETSPLCPPATGPTYRCENNVWDNPGNLGSGEGTWTLCHSPLGFCSCDCVRTPVVGNSLSIAFKGLYFLPVPPKESTYSTSDPRWRVGLDLEIKNLGLWGVVAAFVDDGIKQGNIYGVAQVEFHLEELNPSGATVTMLIDIPGDFQVSELQATTEQLQDFNVTFDNLYLTKLISVASKFMSGLKSQIQKQVAGVIASQVKPLLEHLGTQYVPIDFSAAMQSFSQYVNDNPASQNAWLSGLFPESGVPVNVMGQDMLVMLASGQQLGFTITSTSALDSKTFVIEGHLVSDILIDVMAKASKVVLPCATLKMLDPNASSDFPSGSICGLPAGTSIKLTLGLKDTPMSMAPLLPVDMDVTLEAKAPSKPVSIVTTMMLNQIDQLESSLQSKLSAVLRGLQSCISAKVYS